MHRNLRGSGSGNRDLKYFGNRLWAPPAPQSNGPNPMQSKHARSLLTLYEDIELAIHLRALGAAAAQQMTQHMDG